MNNLTVMFYDGISLTGENVYIFPDDNNLKSPERDVTKYEIPGRNGDVLFDNHRFKNTTLGYKFIVRKTAEYYDWYKNTFLCSSSYRRLEDSTDPEVYRMARCVSVSPLTVWRNDSYVFSAELDAKPQRWLKSGETAVSLTESGTIVSAYLQAAKPLLRVYGYGTMTIGSATVTVTKNSNAYIDIDCDLKDAYCGTTNCNSLISVSDWPELAFGENKVTLPSTMTKVEITPRWWSI